MAFGRVAQAEQARLARLAYFEQPPASKQAAPALDPGPSSRGTRKSERAARMERLSKFRPAESIPPIAESADEDDELKKALALSLQPLDAEVSSSAAAPSYNLWSPPRYVPSTSKSANKTLTLTENVEVRDGGYDWQRATAFLDTGNQHMTIIDSQFAARHALYQPQAQGVFAGADGWTTIRGVVPGASSRAPIVTVALRIRGHEFTISAAVSDMPGHDLLVGIDVLRQLFAAGFSISAGSI